MKNFTFKDREEKILIKRTVATLATFGLVFSLFGTSLEVKAATTNSVEDDELTCVGAGDDMRWLGDTDEVSVNQGKTKEGNAVPDIRTDNTKIFGVYDGTSGTEETFFSLGYGGEVIIKLGEPMWAKDGAYIELYEVTNGASYPEEKAEVYVSADGSNWESVGIASNQPGISSSSRPATVSLADFSGNVVNFIKIVDVTEDEKLENTADGYDLDAVQVGTCKMEKVTTEPDGNGNGNGDGDGGNGDGGDKTIEENDTPAVTSTKKRGGRSGGSSTVQETVPTPTPQVLGESTTTEPLGEISLPEAPLGEVLGAEDFPGMPNAGYLPLTQDYVKLAAIFGALLLIPTAILSRRKFKK